MIKAIRRLTFASLVLALTVQTAFAQELPRTQPEDVGLSAPRLQRLTNALQGYVDDGQLAGSVAIVVRRGKVAYLEAFGHRDREAGSPMTEDAIFRIASQTKAPISVGVLMLQEEGRLLITDPVGKYLPEFLQTKVAEPDGNGGYRVVDANRPITIRDLLTHTAGISYGSGPAADRWAAAGITSWYFADPRRTDRRHRLPPRRAAVRRAARHAVRLRLQHRYPGRVDRASQWHATRRVHAGSGCLSHSGCATPISICRGTKLIG